MYIAGWSDWYGFAGWQKFLVDVGLQSSLQDLWEFIRRAFIPASISWKSIEGRPNAGSPENSCRETWGALCCSLCMAWKTPNATRHRRLPGYRSPRKNYFGVKLAQSDFKTLCCQLPTTLSLLSAGVPNQPLCTTPPKMHPSLDLQYSVISTANFPGIRGVAVERGW